MIGQEVFRSSFNYLIHIIYKHRQLLSRKEFWLWMEGWGTTSLRNLYPLFSLWINFLIWKYKDSNIKNILKCHQQMRNKTGVSRFPAFSSFKTEISGSVALLPICKRKKVGKSIRSLWQLKSPWIFELIAVTKCSL